MTDISNPTTVAIANISRISIDEGFIFRCLMTSSITMVFMLFLAQVFLFAYCLMVFERPEAFNPMAKAELVHFPNALWCTIITMTIVGYGDLYPCTSLGRLAMTVASINAVVMVAITTNIVKIYLEMPRVGESTVNSLTTLSLRTEIKEKAADLIQVCALIPYPRCR